MNLTTITVAPTAASVNAIALTQTPTGGVAYTLTALAGTGLAAAQKITIVNSAGEIGHTFTITGTDADGYAQTETIAGAGAGTMTSVKYYKTVTSISQDINAAGALTVGCTMVSLSPTYDVTKGSVPCVISSGFSVTGTINYSMQLCYTANPKTSSTWVTSGTVTSKTADVEYPFNTLIPTGVRISVASASTGAAVSGFFTQARST